MQKIIPITDLQRAAGQIVTDLTAADDSVVITHRGRPAAVLLSAERYAQMESDLERLDELELIGMVESARAARASGQTLSHDEVKKRLRKRAAGAPKRAGRARR
ncbi:MAG: type II toxin-antitoxin system prevent-host-death family antitoxin [Acidobacteria bacterium]|nr:MAG: type II toxin-antitoxin system prevent-host-death family antitoxin [Acidobacteriota bacterium]